MSGMILHGLGDCTPELNCGCMAKSPDVLRERIAWALWENRYAPPSAHMPSWKMYLTDADAVIADLKLGPAVERYGAQESDGTVYGWEPDAETVRREWPGMPVMRCRFYVTPWERIEEDA